MPYVIYFEVLLSKLLEKPAQATTGPCKQETSLNVTYSVMYLCFHRNERLEELTITQIARIAVTCKTLLVSGKMRV